MACKTAKVTISINSKPNSTSLWTISFHSKSPDKINGLRFLSDLELKQNFQKILSKQNKKQNKNWTTNCVFYHVILFKIEHRCLIFCTACILFLFLLYIKITINYIIFIWPFYGANQTIIQLNSTNILEYANFTEILENVLQILFYKYNVVFYKFLIFSLLWKNKLRFDQQ